MMKKFLRSKYSFLFFSIVIFLLLRIPSLIEPAWYGDEGIYASVANELKNGEILYVDIWDHKPPGIFPFYYLAVISGPFQVFIIKLINLLFGLLTVIFTYFLSDRLFGQNRNKKIIIGFVMLSISILMGSPLLEGNIFNAENIFVPLVLIANYLYLSKNRRNYILIGILFGFSLILKIHPLFDFAVLIWILFLEFLKNKKNFSEKLKLYSMKYMKIFFAFLLPIVLLIAWFWKLGALKSMWNSIFVYGTNYSSHRLADGIGYLLFPDTFFVRLLLITILVLFLSYLFIKNKVGRKATFLFTWLLLTFFAVRISAREYPHYLLQMLVPALLFLGYVLGKALNSESIRGFLLKSSWGFLVIYLFINVFSNGNKIHWGYIDPLNYYKVGYKRLLRLADQSQWYEIFNGDPERINDLASLLSVYKSENVFLWTNTPWVYSVSNVRNPSKYVVYFHIENQEKLIQDIEEQGVSAVVVDSNLEDKLEQVFLKYLSENYRKVKSVDSKGTSYLLYERL